VPGAGGAYVLAKRWYQLTRRAVAAAGARAPLAWSSAWHSAPGAGGGARIESHVGSRRARGRYL